jgi:nucleotide-binding universal stress UspA family protein
MSAKKILVPVDFSEPSRRALSWAFEYAQKFPSEIHILHVVERNLRFSDLGAGIDKLKEELEGIKARSEAELARLAKSDQALVGRIKQHIANGKPASEIIRIATEQGADLIVMGTHGLTGVGRVLIGSVAEQVVRRAPCTVVTVKASNDD